MANEKNSAPQGASRKRTQKLQAVLRPAQPPIQHQKEGKITRLRQKELIIRFTGLERTWAIPLHPGRTGAPRLDGLARQFAWTRWKAAPKVTFRSLSTTESGGICSYLVVHDASLTQISQPSYWDTQSRQYTANKVTASFTHAIAHQALINTQLSNQTDKCSWFLFKFDGKEPSCGELWLEYDIECGGIADLSKTSLTFEVRNGKFYEEGSNKPLEGYPVFGRDTSYHFGGKAPTQEQVKHMLEDLKAVPIQVTRPNTSSPVISPTTPVREVSFHLPQAVIDLAIGVASSVFMQKAYQVIIPMLKYLPKQRLDSRNFTNYSGTVTIQSATHAWYATGAEGTVPPVPRYNLTETQVAALSEYPHLVSYGKRDNTDLPSRFYQIAKYIAAASVALSIENMFRRLRTRPVIVHRGRHAVNFFKLDGGVLDEEDDGEDGNEENPNLPEFPDFDGDPEAPAVVVPWSAAQKYFTGYVVDNNGSPLTHYLTAERHGIDYFSSITPRYYVNHRRVWDKENKRLLAFQLKVSEALKGHYLLLEGYNWGDDGCASWLDYVNGGTYMGCVARFSGITESRSVIRVDDPNEWNNCEVHLVVGQAKDKYRKNDKGRAALFAVRIGAVGSYEVARNYLAVSSVHQSVTRMKNHPMKKGSGAAPSTPFTTLTDFSTLRSTPDPNLDPSTPGFAYNYSSLTAGSRALPYPIEDGPVRSLFLARYDNSNGWWQDVPDAVWTDTDIASYWNFVIKMDGTTDGAVTGFRQPYTICRFSTPPSLTKDAYLCTEIVSLGGSEAGFTTSIVPVNTAYSDYHIATGVAPGPIMIQRTVYKLVDGKLALASLGDTSRPTTSVEGHSNDIYVSYLTRSYLVRDEDIAKRWALWDEPAIGEPLTGWKYIRPTYRLEPTVGDNPWSIGEEVTGITSAVFQSSNAVCTDSCSAFSETGYSVAKDITYNVDLSTLLGHEEPQCKRETPSCIGSTTGEHDPPPSNPDGH